MAKLTVKQRDTLTQALYDATRARDYIMSENIAVCRRGDSAPALTYSRSDGATLAEVTKDYGSHLCGINEAIRTLRAFLDA